MAHTLIIATSPQGVAILIGSPRDGDAAGIDEAIAGHREMERQYRNDYPGDDPRRDAEDEAEITLIPGCTLTNDEPEDEDRIAWSGHESGWLIDDDSVIWEYAVRAA